MIYNYFEVTKKDRIFYNGNIQPRLKCMILDVHCHINKIEHVLDVTQERIRTDWALQAGFQMTVDDAKYYFSKLYPDVEYSFNGFPFPIKEADLLANNKYIKTLVDTNQMEYGLIAIKPDWDIEYLEQYLISNSIAGVKPYPDLLSAGKGAEVSIFDFITHKQLEYIEKTGKCIMLHVPRARRLSDPENIKELIEIIDAYPNIKIIIAHLGRCFNLSFFENAVRMLGEYIHRFWFDTSAVLNPEVLSRAMEVLQPDKLMYGSDLPIFLWHGKRCWKDDKYYNLCREDFEWNDHIEGRSAEGEYTFFVYEQINNLLNTIEKHGLKEEYKNNLFYGNAKKLLDGCYKK